MERIFHWLTKHGGLLRNLAIASVMIAVAVFLYADFRFEPVRASAWFQGEAVLLAMVALVAAGLAAAFTYPSYREWWRSTQRHSHIEFWLEVGQPTLDDPQRVEDGGHLDLSYRNATFQLRLAILNTGNGTLRNCQANICVPMACRINSIDDPRVPHFAIPGTAQNSVIQPGRVERVRATTASADITPGARIFHAEVVGPINTSIPVVGVLAGDDLEPMTTRITVHVHSP